MGNFMATIFNKYFLCIFLFAASNSYASYRSTKIQSLSVKADSIPDWVTRLYTTVDSSGIPGEIKEVIFYRSLTDTSSYCLYTISTGTCFRTYLATQKNKKDYKQLNIEQECDEEASEPEYAYSKYELDSMHHTILITYDTTKPKKKFLQKGKIVEFKKGFNLDNAETYDVITTRLVRIQRKGDFTIKDQGHH